jgi:hypothetical protein
MTSSAIVVVDKGMKNIYKATFYADQTNNLTDE